MKYTKNKVKYNCWVNLLPDIPPWHLLNITEIGSCCSVIPLLHSITCVIGKCPCDQIKIYIIICILSIRKCHNFFNQWFNSVDEYFNKYSIFIVSSEKVSIFHYYKQSWDGNPCLQITVCSGNDCLGENYKIRDCWVKGTLI